MGDTTGIGWCDSTFNPWIGCEKVSPGCAHCYAETLVTGRMARPGTWGADGVRQRTADSTWRHPLRWERDADVFEAEHGHRHRVFCASLADVFEPRPELAPWRRDLFDLIARTPALDWLILTKRPEEARDWLRRRYEDYWMKVDRRELLCNPLTWTSRDGWGWGVHPNVWIGVSIENARHTWRADVLREIPAAVRFISAEPLLGSLFAGPTLGRTGPHDPRPWGNYYAKQPLNLAGIDWLIVGGESGGRDARPMHPEWARELRDACLDLGQRDLDAAFAAGAPDDLIADGITDEMAGRGRPAFFFKQWGSWIPRREDGCPVQTKMTSSRVEPPSVAFFPDGTPYDPRQPDTLHSPGFAALVYSGASPKAGGKTLDGREWCEFPARPLVTA